MNALQPAVVGTPLFPSLVAEAALGYDVDCTPAGWPIFLQFKLADYLKTRRAKQWPAYGVPYFRVTVRRRIHSSQHNLLRALSEAESEVYYAAPAFYRQTEFNQAFVSNEILSESAFIPLRDLPDLADDEQHYITYCRGVPGFRWHSAEREYSDIPVSGDAWLDHLRRLLSDPRRLGRDYFLRLRSLLVILLREHALQLDIFLDNLAVDEEDMDPTTVFRDLRYLLVTYFGVETLILQPRP
jgi:hypothetical protein